MRKRNVILAVVAALVAVAAAAGSLYLARGDRYRLYTNEHARHCWAALQRLAASSLLPSPTSLAVQVTEGDGRVEVSIDYSLGRVLAGAMLDATCIYQERADRATAIELSGMPIDRETLNDVNAALAE